MIRINIQLDDSLKTRLENFASKRGHSLPKSARIVINLGVEKKESEEALDDAYSNVRQPLSTRKL